MFEADEEALAKGACSPGNDICRVGSGVVREHGCLGIFVQHEIIQQRSKIRHVLVCLFYNCRWCLLATQVRHAGDARAF